LAYYYTIKHYKDENKEYNEEWVQEGTSQDVSNFSYFDITEDGLKILFPTYQVGPYSDGEIEITIPEEDLEGIIKEEFLTIEKEEIEIITPPKRDLSKYEGKKLLAFTFDDGPSDGPTNKLLDNLDKYDARVRSEEHT